MDIPRIPSGLPETSPFKCVLLEALFSTCNHSHYFLMTTSRTFAVFSQPIAANKFIAHCRTNYALKLNGYDANARKRKPFFHSRAYLPPPHRSLEGKFSHSSSRGQPLASTVDESLSFMARRGHWPVSLMVKAEGGKVGRIYEGDLGPTGAPKLYHPLSKIPIDGERCSWSPCPRK